MAKNNFIKKRFLRIARFFTHLPLFAKYLTIMTALMLVSYIVLASSQSVFLSNRWTKETQELLQVNVKQSAEYTENLLSKCYTREDAENALVIMCNNIGVTATAIDTDIFFVNHEGKVIICREDFLYTYSSNSDGCLVHSGYTNPKEIIEQVSQGEYFSRK